MHFLLSIQPAALLAETAEEACRLGFSALFREGEFDPAWLLTEQVMATAG